MHEVTSLHFQVLNTQLKNTAFTVRVDIGSVGVQRGLYESAKLFVVFWHLFIERDSGELFQYHTANVRTTCFAFVVLSCQCSDVLIHGV